MRTAAWLLVFFSILGAALAAEAREKEIKPERPQTDESIQPVYPLDVKPHADAEKLCGALYDLPARRRGECCGKPPGTVLTSECVRMLSAAIRSGTVALAEKDLGACTAEIERSYAGCDWVGPNPPALPSSCTGILHGTLASGAVCRSTLECGEGLRCFGVGPTDTGVCGKPRRDGSPCGKVEDPLLHFTRQEAVDAARSECAGTCNRSRCAAAVAEGSACTRNEMCGDGKRCAAGVCVAGATAKDGEKCLGDVCTSGLRCVAGVCAKPKAGGESCQADTECLGACVKAAGAAGGTCDKRCG